MRTIRRALITTGGGASAVGLALLVVLPLAPVEFGEPRLDQAAGVAPPASLPRAVEGPTAVGVGKRVDPASASRAAVSAESDPADPAHLKGVVLDGRGRPLADATVSVAFSQGKPCAAQATWKTDDRGRFAGPAPAGGGDCVLRIERPPCAGRMVPARAGEFVTAVLEAGGSLTGICRDQEGRPTPATVFALAGDWEVEASVGNDGRFFLSGVPPGIAKVRAVAPGYLPASREVRVRADSERQLELNLEPGQTLRIFARVPAAPAGAVQVRLRDANGALLEASGGAEIVLRGLAPGEASLVLSAPGHSLGPISVDVPLGADPESLFVTLRADPVLSGVVLSDHGARVAAARVTLASDPNGLDWSGAASARTDENGAFAFQPTPRGGYRLTIHAPGFAVETFPLLVGEDRELSVSLTPAADLESRSHAVTPLPAPDPPAPPPERLVTGTVRGPDGTLVHSFWVSPAEAPNQATPFKSGRFALALGPETRELLVRPASHHQHGESTETQTSPSPARVAVVLDDHLEITLAPGLEAEGVVVDHAGRPVAGAAILAGPQREEDLFGEGSANTLGMSGEGGAFHLAGLPSEGLTVTVSHPQHAPLHTVLVPGDALRLHLPAPARVAGVVRSEGRPSRGVGLVLEGPCVRRTTSDSEGSFAFEGLAGGRYTVTRVDTEKSTELDVAAATQAEVVID